MESALEDFGNTNKIYKTITGEACQSQPEPACASTRMGATPSIPTQWAEIDENAFQASGSIRKILPSGAYKFVWINGRICFTKVPVNGDSLIDFEDSVFENIVNEIENFWTLKDIFKQYGFLHKRGYLLYGAAGSGKSCLIQRVIKDIFKKNGVVFLCSTVPENVAEGLRVFRMIEENRPLVCIYEDLDAIVAQYGEDDVLSILDGEIQINHVVSMATTNYPEKLDKRIISRPRRFDRVIKIAPPNRKIREAYFINKLGIIEKEELCKWLDVSEDFSFASMAELVVGVRCLGSKLEGVAKRLRQLMDRTPKMAEEDFKVGFLSKE